MSVYIPGDRLWVRLEGFDWWPARAITMEEFAQAGGTVVDGVDLFVMFYEGHTTERSISALNSQTSAHHICFFETSSEKAVTNDEELKAAILHAEGDSTANPLKSLAQGVEKALAGGSTTTPPPAGAFNRVNPAAPSSSTTATARASKRGRAEDEKAAAAASGDFDAAQLMVPASYRHFPTPALISIAEGINDALAAGDVRAVRRRLCELDNVDVLQSQLEGSKIGVAVGNVLGNAACRPLWPLARAVISFWARHLPEETLDAIRRLKQQSAQTTAWTGPPGPESPAFASPLSAFSAQLSASPTFPKTGEEGMGERRDLRQGPQPSSPTSPLSLRTSFFSTLCQLLDDPRGPTRVEMESVEKVAKALARELQGPDERLLLLSRLRNPELGFVRENLLSGRWSAAQYLAQPEDVFLTEKEKEEEERQLRQKLRAFEEAKLAHVNLTSMFTCHGCKGRRCHYYEQQTRSADEPTTKFITCLDCKHVWTEE